ncbi:hypothetical protein O3G_MSEX011131 [Manduca sexta]|uniref:MD-2-related lipid-recognition domain-containing protein n=1 Tax=Manduca sexta TaxID=7130 RepID=A0A921ZJ19_MANSE|nr:hypothetical protein O3G_MSEX011131 [Manduca sexta]
MCVCTAHPGDLPINTYILGCTTPPCILPQLEDCVIDVIFRAPRAIQSMRTLATAYLSVGPITMPVPYDLQANAVTCNFLTNTFCPLLAGEVVQYQLRMFIESFFPAGTATTIEFRVVDQNNVPVLCLRAPVIINPPRNNARNITIGEFDQS